MKVINFLSWMIFFVLWKESSACSTLQLVSEALGSRRFVALPDSYSRNAGLDTGRASYVTNDDASVRRYLYHVILEGGTGRWVINDVLGDINSAVGYVDSWALMPTLIHSLDVRKQTPWLFYNGVHWGPEPNSYVHCVGAEAESAFYLDVKGMAWGYSGFFVETGDDPLSQVYSMVANSIRRFIYKVDDKWLLSGEIGSNHAEAYVEDATAKTPNEITNPFWNFGNGSHWNQYEVSIISGDREANVVRNLHLYRRIPFLPPNQKYFELANGIIMPAIGLGTGGIPKKIESRVVKNALQYGYRLLDLASEHRNEKKIERILSSGENDTDIPLRNEVFMLSKVWPTHLGFHPTTKEIFESLNSLETPYIDMYMIHWPSCNAKEAWMNCKSSDEPSATWRESWNALERAYSEGLINSIGVSNFDSQLLDEFQQFGTVLPHAVQNSAQPGHVDMPVREWCSLHGAVFMPYSTQVKLKTQSSEMMSVVKNIALNHAVSPYAVVSRFFHQSGAAIIPRSSKDSHLQENLNIYKFQLSSSEMASMGWPYDVKRNEL